MIITNDTQQHTYRILADAIDAHEAGTWTTYGEPVITVEA
jgi:hypothetical protein